MNNGITTILIKYYNMYRRMCYYFINPFVPKYFIKKIILILLTHFVISHRNYGITYLTKLKSMHLKAAIILKVVHVDINETTIHILLNDYH